MLRGGVRLRGLTSSNGRAFQPSLTSIARFSIRSRSRGVKFRSHSSRLASSFLRGDSKLRLMEIAIAEESYFAELGEYIPFDSVPGGVPSAVPVEPLAYPAGATTIGWSLDTEQAVYCRYAVAVGSFDATGERAQAFTAEAICDMDGDGVLMAWGYVRPDRESGEAIPGPFGRCSAEGACDPSTGQHRAAVVGPCDEKSGSEVF